VPADDGPTPAGRRYRSFVATTLLFLAVAFALHAPGLSNKVFNSDEAYLATQAQVVNRGGRLYVDTVDRKPPVVPYLYAATFRVTGSDDLLGVRVLAILADVVTALLLAAEARRRFRTERAGVIAGLLFLGSTAAYFAMDVQAANFEVFMLPTMVAAFVLAVRDRPLGAGVAVALSTLTKQTAATTLLPLAWLGWALRRENRRRLFGGWLLLGAGFVVPIVVAALGFGWHDFMHWVFTSNEGYLDANGVVGYVLHRGLVQTLWFVLANLAIVGLCVAAARRWREDADLWLWVIAGVIAVGSGLRFFGHYYIQLLPPLALLATRPLARAPARALAAVAVVAAVPIAYLAVPAYKRDNSTTQRTGRALAAYARAHTGPDARILVWGHLPEVYWRSDRPPATRFETTGFLTGLSGGRPPSRVGMQYAAPEAWDDFDADLRAHPPELIFDLSPADIRNAKYFPPDKFPRFGNYLDRDYRQVATVDGVAVYRPRH
jgi:hypothetical protein